MAIQTDVDAVPGSHEVGSEMVWWVCHPPGSGGRPFEACPKIIPASSSLCRNLATIRITRSSTRGAAESTHRGVESESDGLRYLGKEHQQRAGEMIGNE